MTYHHNIWNKRPFLFACTVLLTPLLTFAFAKMTMDVLEVGKFSEMDPEQGLSEEWEPMDFRGITPTEYSLVEKGGQTVVKAVSEQSSSGLVRRIDIDLQEYPVIRWSWYAENLIEDGNVHEEDGDDYPVRIYVIFDYDLSNLGWWQRNMLRALRTFYGDVPARAINYIWDKETEVGTVVENPYTDLVMMQVVESGDENLQLRLAYDFGEGFFTDELDYGLSLYHSILDDQTFRLVGHNFYDYNRASVSGRRYGALTDSYWRYGDWHTRTEFFLLRFSETLSPDHQLGWFYGSNSELGYMLSGDRQDGHQLIGRLQASQVFEIHESLEGPQRIYSLMLGHNWYLDRIFRLQSNMVYYLPDKPSQLPDSRYQGRRSSLEAMISLQLRL